MVLGTALAIGSALSGIGGSIMGRRDAKKSSAKADEALQSQLGELGKTTNMLDALKPQIDQFAQRGQDSFDRYQTMMGPLEDSLQDYYMNLNPDEYAAQGNQAAQQQYQSAMSQVNDQLAAQGISNSGIQGQIGAEYGTQMAQQKAQNIMNAPGQVAQQQQGWLGQVQNQGNQAFNQYSQGVNAQSNLANQYGQAYNNMANAYGGVANQNLANAQAATQGSANALAQGMSGVGMGLVGAGGTGALSK